MPKKTFLASLALTILISCVACNGGDNYSPTDTVETKADTTESNTTQVSEITDTSSETEAVPAGLSGRYVCDSEYLRTLSDPTYIPAITFTDAENCIMRVFYVGGKFDANGTYVQEGNRITIKLDLAGTHFDELDKSTGTPYMDDVFILEIVDDDRIVLCENPDAYYKGACYAVRPGDPFVRES